VKERQTRAEAEQRVVVLYQQAEVATLHGSDCQEWMSSHHFYSRTSTSEKMRVTCRRHVVKTDPDKEVKIGLQVVAATTMPGGMVRVAGVTVRLDIVGRSLEAANVAGHSACPGNLAASVDRQVAEEEAWDETKEAVASEIHHCKKQ